MSLIRFTGGDSSDGADGAACYVLGDDHVGVEIAERLRAEDRAVSVVNASQDRSELPGAGGEPVDVRVLEESGVADASTAVVATRSDGRNLLIAQLLSARFGVPRVVVLVNDPERLDLLAEAGHEPVCATSALSDALVEAV